MERLNHHKGHKLFIILFVKIIGGIRKTVIFFTKEVHLKILSCKLFTDKSDKLRNIAGR